MSGPAAFGFKLCGELAPLNEKALSIEGFKTLREARVQVLSDTHLRIPFRNNVENRDQFHLLKYLRKINQELETETREPSKGQHWLDGRAEILVLNGDTFEITGSCASYGEGHLPYLADGSWHQPELTRTVIAEILKSNQEIIDEFKRFLSLSKNHKIVFIKGNHDAYLGKDQPEFRLEVKFLDYTHSLISKVGT